MILRGSRWSSHSHIQEREQNALFRCTTGLSLSIFWGGQRQNWNFTWTTLFPFAFCNFLHNREGVTFLRSTACVSTKQLRIKHVLPVNNNFQVKKKKPALCGVGMSRFSPAFASTAVGLIIRLQSLGTRDFERSTQRSRQVDGRSRA